MLTDEQKRVLSFIDQDFVVKFAMDLTDINSPTGAERPAAELVYRTMLSMGLRARMQEITETRSNALGELRGKGGGYTLMFNGHLDISYTDREIYIPGGDYTMFRQSAGTTGLTSSPSFIDNGWICGNGIRNMKSAMAAYLGAVKAIKESGIALNGDILIAAVSGEIEKDGVDDFRGPVFEGHGIGTRHLVTHGGVADMCIIGEPTALKLVRIHMGSVWIKISIRGELVHTALCDSVVNPIDRMGTLIKRIREWIPDYQNRNTCFGRKPSVNLGAIQGGWPWRLSRTPGYCSLYLDVRFGPGLTSLDVKEELYNLIKDLKGTDPEMDIEMELLSSHPAATVEADEPLVQVIKSAHQTNFDESLKEYVHPWLGDATILVNYGIPTIYYGPAGQYKPDASVYSYGWQNIDDLMQCTRVYALSALDICSRTKNQ